MAFVVRSAKVSQESGQQSFVTIGYKGMKYIRVYIYKWFNVCLTEQRASHTFNISDRFIDTGIYKALSGIVYSWCRQTDDGIWNNAMRGGYTRTHQRFDIIELGIILNHGRADRSNLRSRKPVPRDTIFFRSAHHQCITPLRLTDWMQLKVFLI